MASSRKTTATAKPTNKYRYKSYVQSLNERDALSPEGFKETRWATYFSVNSSGMYKNGKVNANHVFEYFGSLNQKSASAVRHDLLQDVATDIDFYERRSTVCLAMHGISLDTWVTMMDNEKMCCDELGLMGLCKLYRHHSVVLTKARLWSTIEAEAPFNLLELLNECNIRFVYLGNLMFGSLLWKPKKPALIPTPKSVLPFFKIIKEYTLDDQEVSVLDNSTVPVSAPSSSDVITPPQHADVLKNASGNVVSDAGDTDQTETKISLPYDGVGTVIPLECGTDSTRLESDPTHQQDMVRTTGAYTDDVTIYPNDDHPEFDLLLSAYPWSTSLRVTLHRVSPETIDKWTVKPIPDVATPPPWTPIITHVKGYGLRSRIKLETTADSSDIKQDPDTEDVSTSDLMKQAESLLSRAQKLVSKPDRKRKHSEMSHLGVETPTTPADQENISPAKPTGKIKCQLCKQKFLTLIELQNHHSTDHSIVKCNKCFNSNESLSKHMQQHTAHQWVCDSCGKGFQYESRMLQHQTVHVREPRHHCPKRDCNKKFKNVGDYNRHIKTHDSGIWYTCSYCTYRNKDKRNCDSHQRTHNPAGSKERNECERCHKQLRFTTQVLRHRESGCNLE